MISRSNAFSLVEVTIALAILAIAVVVCLGVMSVGLSNSRQASEHLVVGLILEDAQKRLERNPLVEGQIQGSPFFYSVEGEDISGEPDGRKFYRLTIALATPSESQLPENATGLMAANMVLAWPVDEQSGEPKGDSPETVDQTLLVGARTGKAWTEVDPEFQPRLEY